MSQLEAVFLPPLNQAKTELSREYPKFSFKVWSSSIGSATPYQGHDLGIECEFPDARDEEANCVALEVGVWHLTTEPEFNSFSVDWCNGTHPNISAHMLEQPVPVSPVSVSRFGPTLRQLLAVFRRAVEAWSSRSAG